MKKVIVFLLLLSVAFSDIMYDFKIKKGGNSNVKELKYKGVKMYVICVQGEKFLVSVYKNGISTVKFEKTCKGKQ